MTKTEILAVIQTLAEEAKTAVLTTVDENNIPHTRWVTPAFIRGHSGSFFLITSPAFAKIQHVQANPHVEWMFQSRSLDRIVTIRGTVEILDDPAIRSEVFEVVAPRLKAFWHATPDSHETVVLETTIEEAVYYIPMKGIKETVSFKKD